MKKATQDSKVFIIGAGPAGISAGYELCRNEHRATVLEKTPYVGGLAKTLQFGNFRTDIGPHRFFSKNQYLYDMIGDVLNEDWILVNRFTRFFIQGKFYLYPVDMKDALKNLGPVNAMKAFFDYVRARLGKMLFHPTVNSFEDYIVQEFGRTLAELNMLNYTEKIWGIPCSEISPDWARQRIKGLSLMSVLKKALLKKQKGPKTLVDQFYYPKWGAGQTYEKMADIMKQNGGEVILSSPVVEVKHKDSKITALTVEDDKGERRDIPVDYVISSMPVTEFVKVMKPAAPDNVLKAADLLKWRSQSYLYLQLNKKRVSKDNWIYFPDREIPFGRLHEPKNFSEVMSPDDKTSLWIEHFVFTDDKRWDCSAGDLKDITLKDLSRLGFAKEEEVEEFKKYREEFVYPVYEIGYHDHISILKEYLACFKNLQLIGRPGRFRYNNQDHSIETGILAARNLIEGGDYDLEKVGSEQEYFERGFIKAREGYIKVKNEKTDVEN